MRQREPFLFGGRGVYRAEDAQTEAEVRARRPKVPKLVTDPQLAEAVTERLEMGWSPHAVAADLRNEGSLSPRAWSMQYHLEVEKDTVRNWGAVDAYREALESALGPNAIDSLAAEADYHMAGFAAAAKRLYRNFMAAAVQDKPGRPRARS